MKAAAMSVWVFINLLCFGMCGYLYLIWSQYWMYIEKQRLFSKSQVTQVQKLSGILFNQDTFVSDKLHFKPFNSTLGFQPVSNKNRRSAIGALWGSFLQTSSKSGHQVNPSSIIVRQSNGSPRFPNIHRPLLEFDTDKYVCDDITASECVVKTAEFKELLLKEFHRVLMGDSKVFKSGLVSHNTYDVKYEGQNRQGSSRHEIMCALKRTRIRTITANDKPFQRLGFRIPGAPLQERRVFNTCAVVTSAGALLNSRLGNFIDSHDMVLRFNNAPTENYTDDVGSKTTFRILNSQLKPPAFTIKLIAFLTFTPFNYTSRRPEADVHILNPQVLWELWTILQDSSPYRLRRNPPSSGFLGIWFSMHRCNRVRVFEYVPSVHVSRRCHYHAVRDDPACTFGAWHPLAQEKALVERLRDNSDIDVFQRGFIDILGFNTLNC
ncbi:hypothetical protein K1T71_003241 [Dendrolimus kikuchii]|uniref:Uncharacterized protein n=1 Tax=Dendrolimus kikuchii TaxID=765133 RepID=A0ACC1DBY2_9NEOP|nr:hypothetical protein K1T71_003241 [Dendrolimus kikuchii]